VATFGLVVNAEKEAARSAAAAIAKWLEERGHGVRSTGEGGGDAGLDFVLSIGGDGTMLRAIDLVGGSAAVLGINIGHLGYLTEVEAGVWPEALERVLTGEFSVEERMTLTVQSGGIVRTALNDAVVEKAMAGHTVRVALGIGGRPFLSYAADGVIVATATGSTAYNLSAGGPILSPRLEAIVVTPVAPHLLFDRAMVLDPSEEVRLEVLAGRAQLAVDGASCGALEVGGEVVCRASPSAARLISFGGRDFRHILKTKFSLGDG